MRASKTNLCCLPVLLIVIVVSSISFLCSCSTRGSDLPDADVQEHVFQLPAYVQLDDGNTCMEPVDVTGTWTNVDDDTDVVELHADATYVSSRLANEGTYETRDGYVALVSNKNIDTALRIVWSTGDDVLLLRDDENLTKVYYREGSDSLALPADTTASQLPENPPEQTPGNQLPSASDSSSTSAGSGNFNVSLPSGEDSVTASSQVDFSSLDEAMVLHLEGVQTVFEESVWRSKTEGISKISVSPTTISLYEKSGDTKPLAKWDYVILPPEDGIVPMEFPFSMPILVEGNQYILTLHSASQYNAGYDMSIACNGEVLIEAASTNRVSPGGVS